MRPPSWRSVAKFGAVLFTGALGGLCAATALARYSLGGVEQRAGGSPTVREMPSRDFGFRAAAQGQVVRRLVALEEAVASSGTAVAKETTTDQQRTTESRRPMPEPTPEHDKELQAKREDWARAHAEEGLDESWADGAAAEFGAALRRAAERSKFVVRGIDCRTTRCRVELEWPSYEVASATFGDVLLTSLPGCGSAILLDPPRDPTAPYQGWAMYNCEDARAMMD
jgi:hypothetical protein